MTLKFHSWVSSKDMKNTCLHTDLHMNINGSIIYNSPKVKSTKMSINSGECINKI